MSEHALSDIPASLTEPAPATAAPFAAPSAAAPGSPPAPAPGSVITLAGELPPLLTTHLSLDGDAPRLAATTPAATPPTPTVDHPATTPPATTPLLTTHLSLDGDAPRLAATAPIVADRSGSSPTGHGPLQANTPITTIQAPSLPPTSPAGGAPTTQVLANMHLPATHATHPAGQPHATGPATTATDSPSTDEPVHPMAHLMPSKQSGPNEASRRAAEKRAIQKAKAKKTKIAVISGIVVVTAVVGPPLTRWLVDAVNDAGKTSSVVEPAE